jgi:lipopolysaccharide transport system permease protein
MPNLDQMNAPTLSKPFSTRIFWTQARALTAANLKSRYRNTIAGFLWVVLSPLITYGAQSFVFHTILQLQVRNYHLFLLTGLLPWIFFQQSVEMCTSLYTSSSRLLKSLPVHPLVYLTAQLLDNLVNFFAVFFLLLLPATAFGQVDLTSLILLPIPIFFLLLGVFGICWLLAVLQVFLRDTRFIASFALNILFFLTPIFYPVEFVPEKFRWMVTLNPVNYLIQPFRGLLHEFNGGSFLREILSSAAVSLSLAAAGYLYWRVKRNEVYHAL